MTRTCSISQTGSINVNVFGGGHTCPHCGQKQFQETSHTLAFGWHAPGLKIGCGNEKRILHS